MLPYGVVALAVSEIGAPLASYALQLHRAPPKERSVHPDTDRSAERPSGTHPIRIAWDPFRNQPCTTALGSASPHRIV